MFNGSRFMLHDSRGITLIEMLVGTAVFSIFAFGIYFTYSSVLDIITRTRLRSAATSILEREIEIVRNMAYGDVGIQGGSPPGKIAAQKVVYYASVPFQVNAYVRNYDDPFDGTATSVPVDTAPADYRLVEFQITCPACIGFAPIIMTARAAPKSLEGATGNGSLFINVFDASGAPISGATVTVINNVASPTISITDTTNINGVLQLVDIPTSTSAYQISVSKANYSSDRTRPLDDLGNPNPVKPHATIAKEQVTDISFAIDKLASLALKTVSPMCAAVPNVTFSVDGAKLVGTAPDVLKFSTSSQTDANGNKSWLLEWDTYSFYNVVSAKNLSGYTALPAITLNPSSSASMTWLFEDNVPAAMLFTVTDQIGAPINDASVRLVKGVYDKTFMTGARTASWTDWSGGQYSVSDGGLETENPAGQVTLLQTGGVYATGTESWFISQTSDFGTISTNFFLLSWTPTNQPPSTTLRFQIATNNDDATWDYLGPDGTSGSYYTVSGTQLAATHSGNRYLRYKAYFETNDEAATPSLEDIELGFRSNCIPPGQILVSGLEFDNYSLDIQKAGYQTYSSSSFAVSANWAEQGVMLQP